MVKVNNKLKTQSKTKPLVFITRPIPQEGIDLIKPHARIILRKNDSWISRKELLAGVKNADILLPILTDKLDGPLMDAAPKLKLIANFGVGYNNIDVDAATKRSIRVTNTPGVLTETTAEFTMGLLLSVAHRIVECDTIMRTGKYPGWGPMLYMGHEVTGKTLGIIGLGRIGSRVAEIASQGFGMKILYHTKDKAHDIKRSIGAQKVALNTLLKQSDFVTLHVPLTDSTHHLISTKELKAMKSSAFLVNTSRGPVVDEKALVKALQTGQIAGAGLDVYENEPKMAAGLSKLKNTVLAPHIGSAGRETRGAMSIIAAQNVVAFIKGKKLPTPVN